MLISEDISNRIADQIAGYREKPFGPIPHQLVVLKLDVLPLLFDLSGGYAIRRDGQIINYSIDDPEGWCIEEDERVRNIALFQGSRLYKEIIGLLPRKSSQSKICSQCNGTGIPLGVNPEEQANIICYCGGLGWLP